MLHLALLLAIDYGVAFLPAAGDRQVVVVYNAGDSAGTHPYKLVMRAFAPDGSLTCEASATVAPWSGRMTMKRIAWFEATYSNGSAKVRPGKYLLRAYLTEQIPPGQSAEDSNLGNNQYPLEPPRYVPVEFTVRPGADQIRCAAAPVAPNPEIYRGEKK